MDCSVQTVLTGSIELMYWYSFAELKAKKKMYFTGFVKNDDKKNFELSQSASFSAKPTF